MKRILTRLMRTPPRPQLAITSLEEKEALRVQHAELERRLRLLTTLGEHFK